MRGKIMDPKAKPDHQSIFKVGEKVAIKMYTFEVAYIGETSILLEPVGPIKITGPEQARAKGK